MQVAHVILIQKMIWLGNILYSKIVLIQLHFEVLVSMTIVIDYINFGVRCTECNYLHNGELKIGQSIGDTFDKILVDMITPCPKCNKKPDNTVENQS